MAMNLITPLHTQKRRLGSRSIDRSLDRSLAASGVVAGGANESSEGLHAFPAGADHRAGGRGGQQSPRAAPEMRRREGEAGESRCQAAIKVPLCFVYQEMSGVS